MGAKKEKNRSAAVVCYLSNILVYLEIVFDNFSGWDKKEPEKWDAPNINPNASRLYAHWVLERRGGTKRRGFLPDWRQRWVTAFLLLAIF